MYEILKMEYLICTPSNLICTVLYPLHLYFHRYTGHCPTLKFRFGKRYGANTKEIIQEFKDVSPIKFVKKYKEGKPWSDILQSATGEKPEPDPVTYTNLPRRQFILGYTGKWVVELIVNRSLKLFTSGEVDW